MRRELSDSTLDVILVVAEELDQAELILRHYGMPGDRLRYVSPRVPQSAYELRTANDPSGNIIQVKNFKQSAAVILPTGCGNYEKLMEFSSDFCSGHDSTNDSA